jgi:hypothetical protein
MMAFVACAQNNKILFNSAWFSDEAHFRLDDVVNKQNVRAILGIRISTCFMRSCTMHRELRVQCGSPSQLMDC